jgi:vancomycin permeability regulator SanA
MNRILTLLVSLAEWLGWSVAVLAIAVMGCGLYVRHVTRLYRVDAPEAATVYPVAIVFGAGVWADGTPTPMLADRVRAGIALYQLGKVDRLLMSGDNRVPEYNEVGAMRQFAIDRGVPETAILVDRFGLNTYATCDRARREFGIDRAILVTQEYHLPRAVYICRRLGVEAIGVGVRDWGVYRYRSMLEYSLREAIATVKAWWQTR